MLAEELHEAQQRAATQAEERNVRHEARSRSKETLSQSDLEVIHSPNSMEEHQYGKIIDSILIFGQSNENVKDWLEIVSLKFDIIGYDSRQKRRFIPQYLTGNALKRHLTHRDDLLSWDDYTTAITSAFSYLATTSHDINLQLLRSRLQGNDESFTDYSITL